MYSTYAWAKKSKEGNFEKISIKRNINKDHDVTFELRYCGICHTDVNVAENFFGNALYPCVPGHELAGVVTSVGRGVSRVRVGDKVGVGYFADACKDCHQCDNGIEQFCDKGMTMTFNDKPGHGNLATDSGWTYGGYSGQFTAPENFVVKIPDDYPLENAGPVLCAGVTMFSPLKNYGADKGGLNVGVVGIGGLGQFGVTLAKAMGNTVYAISTSPNKEAAAREIGADNFVVSTNAESMKASANSLDLILNTVSADHDLNVYLPLLRPKGVLVQIGLAMKPHSVNQIVLLSRGLSVAGSMVGGIAQTQECVDFCHQHNILPKIKLVQADELDRVFSELNIKNDSVLRYVLDIRASAA